MTGCLYLIAGLLLAGLALGAHQSGNEVWAVGLGSVAALAVFYALLRRPNRGGHRRVKRDASWRNDPATAKQIAFAKELGIRLRRGMTKGEVSDLISRETEKGD
jgi:hypothetical protein